MRGGVGCYWGRVVLNGRGDAVREAVAEIEAAGGVAAVSQRGVREGAQIVADALDAFGRLDALVHNAGVVADRSFPRMSDDDWSDVLDVNLNGARACLAAAWPHLLEQEYGRVVVVSSSAGMLDNFGQANYAASKGALLALAATLAREGERKGVLANSLNPVAATPMTSAVFPEDVLRQIAAERVAPVVVAMCHRAWAHTGQLVEAGGGWGGVARWQRSAGVRFDGAPDAGGVIDRWAELARFDDRSSAAGDVMESVSRALGQELPGLAAAQRAPGGAAAVRSHEVGSDLRGEPFDAGGRARRASSGRLCRCAAASAGLVVGSMVVASVSAVATVAAAPVCPSSTSDPEPYLAEGERGDLWSALRCRRVRGSGRGDPRPDQPPVHGVVHHRVPRREVSLVNSTLQACWSSCGGWVVIAAAGVA